MFIQKLPVCMYNNIFVVQLVKQTRQKDGFAKVAYSFSDW